MNRVPLIKADLPPFEAIEGPIREILDNGRITNFGKYVTQFEEEVGLYLGTHTATVSSGTMGLILTLQALGLRPGDKVVVPSFTFMATAQAILYAGGIPLFAEIGEDFTISTEDLEQLLAKHDTIGAVLPVHMYGLPCQVSEIERLVEAASKRCGRAIPVLYDAAHAFGSSLNGNRVGTFGAAEVFSLSVTKALVSVEGGMISSRDPELIHRIRKMRNYGIHENYDAGSPGLNGKMSEFHAIIGLWNLSRLDHVITERQRKAGEYRTLIESRTHFEILAWPRGIVQTWKDFTILFPKDIAPRRTEAIELLKEKGIETRAYFFPPVHEQGYFKRFQDRPLPKTEELSRRVLTLPFYTQMTGAEMEEVVEALEEVEKSMRFEESLS